MHSSLVYTQSKLSPLLVECMKYLGGKESAFGEAMSAKKQADDRILQQRLAEVVEMRRASAASQISACI